MTYLTNNNQELRVKSQAGVTLLLAILVLSSLLAISFSLATILFVEVRSSGDLLRTEATFYATQGVSEQIIYNYKRKIPDGLMVYPTQVANVQLSDPYVSSQGSYNGQQDVVKVNTTFANTTNHYAFYDPNNPIGPSGYGALKIYYQPTGVTDAVYVYLCQYNPGYPVDSSGNTVNSYNSTPCSDMNERSKLVGNNVDYWLDAGVLLRPINSPYTHALDSTLQQELILYNPSTANNIYVKIQGFSDTAAQYPEGLPYFNQTVVNVSGSNSGVNRNLKVTVPQD